MNYFGRKILFLLPFVCVDIFQIFFFLLIDVILMRRSFQTFLSIFHFQSKSSLCASTSFLLEGIITQIFFFLILFFHFFLLILPYQSLSFYCECKNVIIIKQEHYLSSVWFHMSFICRVLFVVSSKPRFLPDWC